MAAFIRVNRNYNFIDKSPICDELATAIDDQGLRGKKNVKKVALLAGVGVGTVDGILYGGTRDPRNSTVERILIGIGCERVIRRAGNRFDLEKELEAARVHRREQNKLAREHAKKSGRKKSARKKKNKKPHLRLVA